MKARPPRSWTAVLYCLLASGLVVEAIEPVSTSLLLLGTGAAMLSRKLYRFLYETCDENWLTFNQTGEHVISMCYSSSWDDVGEVLCIISSKSAQNPLLRYIWVFLSFVMILSIFINGLFNTNNYYVFRFNYYLFINITAKLFIFKLSL